MSYELANESGLLGQFASGAGYDDLIKAIGGGAKYPYLHSLVTNGASEHVTQVTHELSTFVGAEKNAELSTTAQSLMHLAQGQEIIVITNGMLPDDEDADKSDGPYDWHAEGNIVKLDAPQQLVFGWASIVKVGDRTLTDTQDDQISPDTIEAAAYDFVMHARIGGAMHNQDGNEQPIQVSTLVESVVFTDEKVAAIVKSLNEQGIKATMDLGCVGWWVGFKVADKQTWDAIADGTLKAFSVGGRGKREKIGKAEPQAEIDASAALDRVAAAKALKRVERALAWHESA